jgi:hypothetical protein
MKFTDFLLKNTLTAGYFVVGYDENTGVEIRIPVGNLGTAGAAGASVDMQYSANASSWHYPDAEGDQYIRFKKGTDAWSTAFKIKTTEAIVIEYSADGNTWNDSYTAGDLYMRINSGDALRIKGETGERGEQGIQGQQGIQGVPGEQGIPGIPGPAGVVDISTLTEIHTAGNDDLVLVIQEGVLYTIKKDNLFG